KNRDGGWAATLGSRQRKAESDPNITGTVLEALGVRGMNDVQQTRDRGAKYLRASQQADGSWANADGRQRILCTSQAVRGLLAAGEATDDDAIAAATNWLKVEQQ